MCRILKDRESSIYWIPVIVNLREYMSFVFLNCRTLELCLSVFLSFFPSLSSSKAVRSSCFMLLNLHYTYVEVIYNSFLCKELICLWSLVTVTRCNFIQCTDHVCLSPLSPTP